MLQIVVSIFKALKYFFIYRKRSPRDLVTADVFGKFDFIRSLFFKINIYKLALFDLMFLECLKAANLTLIVRSQFQLNSHKAHEPSVSSTCFFYN